LRPPTIEDDLVSIILRLKLIPGPPFRTISLTNFVTLGELFIILK